MIRISGNNVVRISGTRSVALLGCNAYLAVTIYARDWRRLSREHLNVFSLLMRLVWTAFAFGCLLLVALVFLPSTVSALTAWRTAALISGIILPILFAEEYAADLFWNRNRELDSIGFLGLCAIVVVSSVGLMTAMSYALQGRAATTVARMAPFLGKSVVVTLLTLLMCLAVALVTAWTLKSQTPNDGPWSLTDHPPMYNICQNLFLFSGLFYLVVIPAALVFVYRENSLAITQKTDGLATAYTAIAIAAVGIPVYNNHEHLRNLEQHKAEYPSYDSISSHIMFINCYVGCVTVFTLGWVWLS